MSRNKIARQISDMASVALIEEIATLLEAHASPSLSFAGVLLDEVKERLAALEAQYSECREKLRELTLKLEGKGNGNGGGYQ